MVCNQSNLSTFSAFPLRIGKYKTFRRKNPNSGGKKFSGHSGGGAVPKPACGRRSGGRTFVAGFGDGVCDPLHAQKSQSDRTAWPAATRSLRVAAGRLRRTVLCAPARSCCVGCRRREPSQGRVSAAYAGRRETVCGCSVAGKGRGRRSGRSVIARPFHAFAPAARRSLRGRKNTDGIY